MQNDGKMRSALTGTLLLVATLTLLPGGLGVEVNACLSQTNHYDRVFDGSGTTFALGEYRLEPLGAIQRYEEVTHDGTIAANWHVDELRQYEQALGECTLVYWLQKVTGSYTVVITGDGTYQCSYEIHYEWTDEDGLSLEYQASQGSGQYTFDNQPGLPATFQGESFACYAQPVHNGWDNLNSPNGIKTVWQSIDEPDDPNTWIYCNPDIRELCYTAAQLIETIEDIPCDILGDICTHFKLDEPRAFHYLSFGGDYDGSAVAPT